MTDFAVQFNKNRSVKSEWTVLLSGSFSFINIHLCFWFFYLLVFVFFCAALGSFPPALCPSTLLWCPIRVLTSLCLSTLLGQSWRWIHSIICRYRRTQGNCLFATTVLVFFVRLMMYNWTSKVLIIIYPPSVSTQVAVKNSIDVFYFSVLIPLNIFFVEDGKMGKVVY